jgi:hypothetical protein
VATIRSNRQRQCRAEGGLHDDQGRDRGPLRRWHLREARYQDRRGRGDGGANTVCDRRKVLLVPSPEFHK